MIGEKQLELGGCEIVYDLVVAGERVVALYEDSGPEKTCGLSITNLVFTDAKHESVPGDTDRVAITRHAVFLAGNDRVVTWPEQRLVTIAPIDLASTPDHLAVLHRDRIAIFDATGTLLEDTPLYEATAVAVDPVEPGWLVALDGGVFHFDTTLRKIASCAEPITKLRRTPDAVYVMVDRTLRKIAGEEQTDLHYLDDNAWWWNDFDAQPSGLDFYDVLGVWTGR
jgi:hypothetical protein